MAEIERETIVKYEIIDGPYKGREVPFPLSQAPSEGDLLDYVDVSLICVGRRQLRQTS